MAAKNEETFRTVSTVIDLEILLQIPVCEASVDQTCVCIHLQKEELINCGLHIGLQKP